MELRSPGGAEAEGGDEDADGRVAVAHRRAAVDGVVEQSGAAIQTARTRRGSCGACKWARGVVSTAIPILAPLPNIACHVMQAKSVGKLPAHSVGLAA